LIKAEIVSLKKEPQLSAGAISSEAWSPLFWGAIDSDLFAFVDLLTVKFGVMRHDLVKSGH
jgi:hypothetical protein